MEDIAEKVGETWFLTPFLLYNRKDSHFKRTDSYSRMYATLTCLDGRYQRGGHRDGGCHLLLEVSSGTRPPLSLESFECTRGDALQCVCLLCFNGVMRVGLNRTSVRIIFSHCPLPPHLDCKLVFLKTYLDSCVLFFESD